MNFCDLQRFRGKTALLQPKIPQTDLQSPRKTAPVRRLTVNRKLPVNRFAVALSSELPEFSTAVLAGKQSPDNGWLAQSLVSAQSNLHFSDYVRFFAAL